MWKYDFLKAKCLKIITNPYKLLKVSCSLSYRQKYLSKSNPKFFF